MSPYNTGIYCHAQWCTNKLTSICLTWKPTQYRILKGLNLTGKEPKTSSSSYGKDRALCLGTLIKATDGKLGDPNKPPTSGANVLQEPNSPCLHTSPAAPLWSCDSPHSLFIISPASWTLLRIWSEVGGEVLRVEALYQEVIEKPDLMSTLWPHIPSVFL